MEGLIMFLKITKQFGKPICAALYVVFAILAAKKKPLPLLVLLSLHIYEYFHIGRKVAKENGLSVLAGLAKCLAFGFTWWLPLQKG
jgi:hypothetical protein